jgi:hypothetical protein
LSGKKNPLLTWSDGSPVVAPTAENSREFVKRELRLTPLGRDVLSSKKDWQAINTQSRWLGGVEIRPGTNGWRWDAGQRILVDRSAAPTPTKPKEPATKQRQAAVKKKPATRRRVAVKKKSATKRRPGAVKKKAKTTGAKTRARKNK